MGKPSYIQESSYYDKSERASIVADFIAELMKAMIYWTEMEIGGNHDDARQALRKVCKIEKSLAKALGEL